MSTNYYLRHKPSFTQINELTDLIRSTKDGEHFQEVIDMVNKIYGEPDEYDQSKDWGKLHIGKCSSGWKFQWCPNIIKKDVSYMEDDEYITKYEYEYRYPLTKQGLTEFIMRDDIVVVDEYDEVQDKQEFLDMAFNWDVDGWDSFEHINLIVGVEKEFGFKIPMGKVVTMKNVGEMVDIILQMGH